MPSAIWKKGTKDTSSLFELRRTKDTSSLFELRRTKDRCAKGLKCSSRWICCQWEFAAGGNSKFRSAFKSFFFERSGHLSSLVDSRLPSEPHPPKCIQVLCPCVFCPHLWVRDFLRNLTHRSAFKSFVLCPYVSFSQKRRKSGPFQSRFTY